MRYYEIERTIRKRAIVVKKKIMASEAFEFLDGQDYDHFRLFEVDQEKGTRKKILEKLKNGKVKQKVRHNHKEIDVYIHLNTELRGEAFRLKDEEEADFYIKDYFPDTGLFILVTLGEKKDEIANQLWRDIKKNMPKLHIRTWIKCKGENSIWVVPKLITHFAR